MSIPKIAKAMEYIDDDLITGAIAYKKTKKKNTWVRWAALAACLCLAVAGTIIWQKNKAPGNETADMIGFFIYQGNRYVQYEWIDDADIVGEYLGTVTGVIDEWTPKKGYTELAGSVNGDFFRVKGYDPAFMLCMKDETGVVSTYINSNGIPLKYGSDLYEDQLHLSDNYTAVQYETRESWNFGKNELYQMNGNDEVIGSFIEQLDQAEFISWDDAEEEKGQPASSPINDIETYHVYFRMLDGTTIHLRLYENGYVRFQGILDACVQLPEDSFNALIDVMKNHIDSEPVPVSSEIEAKLEKCKNDPELGRYIPTYEVPGCTLMAAAVSYYLEPQTGVEKGTKEIRIEYGSADDPKLFYMVTISWKNEYGKNGWAGPMLHHSELSAEALTEYEHVSEPSGVTKIDVGAWYDDVSVVLSASGFAADTAYEIFHSIK